MSAAPPIDTATMRRARESELSELIRAEQVRLLYRQLPVSTGGSMMGALLLAGVMWSVVSHNAVIGWFACMAANQAWRLFLYFRFRAIKLTAADLDKWANLWALGSLISGCIWGAASFVLFVPHSEIYQGFLVVLIFGVTSAAVLLIGAHLPSFYAFVFPALLPIVVRNVIEGEPAHLTLAFIAGASTLAILSFGRNYNRVLVESLRNRFENETLAREISHRAEELERVNAAAEAARAEAEIANRSKTQFFAAASHDLRQPLHALGLFAAALSEKVKDPEVVQVVNSINASVDALEGLFNELLDISKIDAGAVKPNPGSFAIGSLLERLRMDFEPEAYERGLQLRIRPSRLYVYSDAVLVERILRNLITNALRYTQKGRVLVAARRRGGRVLLQVWDTGPGIPPEARERIFEEFYQIGNPERNSRKGLGLGLSIVRRLSQLLTATVTLDSTVGRGSRFTIALPRGQQPLPADAPAGDRRGAPGDLSGARIAVVEDETVVLEGMRVLLEGWGARVVAASSGDELLDGLAAAPGPPHLVIADYRLREGHSGVEAIRAVRERYGAAVPAIIVTGSTTPFNLEEAKALGAHLLLKPVMPAKLRTLINFKLQETA
jgi:signal transduction histidine kinase/CheY-like chemotaxis protein